MLVTEPCPELIRIVEDAVRGGVDIVQYRDREATHESRLLTTNHLQEITRSRALLVVNGDLIRADGVHLPESGPTIKHARAVLGKETIIGRSVHSVEAARQAAKDGADYLVAGTIFRSMSHPDTLPAGVDFLHTICSEVQIPVIAIGGITADNAASCLQAGAWGIAVMSSIMGASDPETAARSFRQALNRFEGKAHD